MSDKAVKVGVVRGGRGIIISSFSNHVTASLLLIDVETDANLETTSNYHERIASGMKRTPKQETKHGSIRPPGSGTTGQ